MITFSFHFEMMPGNKFSRPSALEPQPPGSRVHRSTSELLGPGYWFVYYFALFLCFHQRDGPSPEFLLDEVITCCTKCTISCFPYFYCFYDFFFFSFFYLLLYRLASSDFYLTIRYSYQRNCSLCERQEKNQLERNLFCSLLYLFIFYSLASSYGV